MIEVKLNLVTGRTNRFVTSELELSDQIFVGILGESAISNSKNKNEKNISFQQPEILRRTPQTSEKELQKAFVTQKIKGSDMKEDETRHLSLQHAPLISDMRAFKASNPNANMEDFKKWYNK